jgi:polyisoprenoid-binding protein YceI
MLLLSAQASALEFRQVQANESTVSFGYKQMGVPMEGKFNSFTTQLAFDPAKVAVAQARIEINLASIDTGSTEANDEVAGKLWFNAKTYPVASFVSSSVKALGGNRYEVAGKLSIKGTTREVVAPVTFQSTGARGAFDGAFTIKRLDYKIGEGEWTDVSTVANEIQIKFHVVVTALPSKK